MRDAWGFGARDIEALASDPGTPVLVEENVRTLSDDEQGALEARLHLHALFREDLSHFEQAIRDLEGQHEFLPDLEASEVVCSDGRPVSYAKVNHKLAFRFLFFSREYEYVLHYFLDDTAADGEGLNVWWEMAEAKDDQIIATDGSWYFEPVVVDGTEYTYMAYGSHTVFRERKLGLQKAMERFGERNAGAAMRALHEEAERYSD